MEDLWESLKITSSNKKLTIFSGKLAQKILIFFVLASFLPLLIGSLISYYHVQKIIKTDTINTLQSISKEYGLSLFSRLKLAKDTLANNADELLTQDNLSFVQNNVSLYFSSVIIRSSNEKKTVLWGEASDNIDYHKIDDSSRIITIKNTDRKQNIYIALKNGIYGRVNSKFLWDARAIADEAQLCVTTFNDGVLFCNENINKNHLEEIKKTVTSKKSRLLTSVDKSTLSTYWPLFMDHEFNIDDWIIIASQSSNIAKKRSAEFRNIFLPLILFSLLLVVLLSSIIIRKNLDIIRQLIDGTRKILNNNYDSAIKINSDDEFGELAVSFNEMASGLRNINTEYQRFYKIDQLILSSSDSEEIVKSIIHCLAAIIDCESVIFINTKRVILSLDEFYYYSKDKNSHHDLITPKDDITETNLQKINLSNSEIDYINTSIDKAFPPNRLKIKEINNIEHQHLKKRLSDKEKLACVIPISHDSKNWTYIIATFDDQIVNHFTKSKLINFSHRVGVAFEALNRESMLSHRANYDSLTNLPNRSQTSVLFEKKLSSLNKNNTAFAFLFIDLDGFKLINDNYGHNMGDKLLKAFTARVHLLLNNDECLSRLSGDEFIVITQPTQAASLPIVIEVLCKRLIKEIQQPFTIDNKVLTIGSSIGISTIPDSCDTYETALRYADIAMYFSKNKGGNQYTVYEYGMSEYIVKQNILEKDLIKAIEQRKIEVYFQVKVDAQKTGINIVGFESLFRWTHKTYGSISPITAIDIAEKTGAIHELGQLVFEMSISQWQQWLEKGYKVGNISINVSPDQLVRDNFIEFITNTVERFPLVTYSMIELEVTESVMINDKEKSLSTLQDIRDLGIKIAIDDFGTGYSSLSYLLDLPATTLKIDRSFIIKIEQDKNALALLTSLISLGKSIGYVIVAEGVETTKQAEFLAQCDTDQLQGYLFSKPLPSQLVEQRFFNTLPN